jgi:hypothetical protein
LDYTNHLNRSSCGTVTQSDTSRKLEEMERNLHEGAPQAPIYTHYGGSTLF